MNVSLGLLIAYYRDSWLDRISTALFIMAMSVSYLVYVIGLQYFLSYKLGWFPINGYEPGSPRLKYLALPWLIIVLVSMGPDVRFFRTVFLDETPGRLRAHRARQGRGRDAACCSATCSRTR